uniref:Putative hydrogenase 4, membrane subunit n=1 Tax=mine drainage metagenome TaxID=410659 RepID=E6Q3B4_9ZZZZ
MILALTLFPVLAFAVASIPRQRSLRLAARTLFSIAITVATFALVPQLDALSAIFACTVSLLMTLVVLFAGGLFPAPSGEQRPAWSRPAAFFLLVGAFWSSMLFAVTATTFVGLWAGITATTLATTFLVAHLGGRTALEAAWKYLMLCSFGIAVALIGAFMLARAAGDAGMLTGDRFSWSVLALHGAQLNTPLARTGLLLMLVGFATKAGLVPMHAWLPDAHAKAPAPVSAMLSGLLVSCAFYAIVRVQGVTLHTDAAPLFEHVLRDGGALSLLLGAALMLAQRDIKRLLSYSTIEHAGIVAIALSLATPLGYFIAIYHLIDHAFVKSLAFLSVGVVQNEQGTTSMGHIRGLRRRPAGIALLFAAIGLGGLPPGGLFLSELLLMLALVSGAHYWLAVLAAIALLVGFAALLRFAIESAAGTPAVAAVSSSPKPLFGYTSVALWCVGVGALALAIFPFLPQAARLLELSRTLAAGG